MKKVAWLVICVLAPLVSFAWNDCPYGKTDGSYEYPGECSHYTDTNGDEICDHSQLSPENKNDLATSLDDNILEDDTVSGIVQDTDQKNKSTRYPLVSITIAIIILYGITFSLVKNKIITLVTHRKIWNTMLAISFLTSLLLGILLIIKINFGTAIYLPFDIIYWHVVLGIVMAVISIFHIGWHWRYYKNFMRK